MKKYIILLITLLLLVSMNACAGREGGESVIYTPERPTETEAVETGCFYDVASFSREDGYMSYSAGETLTGVDVSSWQGEIDWQAVAASGVDFAMIRAGYRGYTDGELHEDEFFDRNLSGAKEAGLRVGAYFFSQALDRAEAIEEADFLLEVLDGREMTFPVAYDWEYHYGESSDGRANDIETQTLCDNAKLFCTLVKNAGYEPMIYFNIALAYSYYDLEAIADYDFWYAEYADAPHFPLEARMWQYTSSGRVDGISGDVDMDMWFVPAE